MFSNTLNSEWIKTLKMSLKEWFFCKENKEMKMYHREDRILFLIVDFNSSDKMNIFHWWIINFNHCIWLFPSEVRPGVVSLKKLFGRNLKFNVLHAVIDGEIYKNQFCKGCLLFIWIQFPSSVVPLSIFLYP
jgi:hypothetical protein